MLEITGQIAKPGSKGLVELNIDGPQSQKITIGYNATGYYESRVIVDREWPSGEYTINAISHQQNIATDKFYVKNLNEKKIPKVGWTCFADCDIEPITGTITLESTESNDFNILLISGNLHGDNLPETVGIKISNNNHQVDVITADLEFNGDFATSLDLYDYLAKSQWDAGTYIIELVNIDENHESYSITDEFIITESGKAITDTSEGISISEFALNRQLKSGETVETGMKTTQMNIFGNLDDHGIIDYKRYSTIEISIVTPDGEIRNFSVFGKADGSYSMPLVVDDTWAHGEYDVYVNFNDINKNTMSFNLGEKLEVEIHEVEEEIEQNEIVLDKVDITFDDLHKTEFVTFSHSTTDATIQGEITRVILEKPNGLKEYFYVIIDETGKFDMPLLIENSWAIGDYTLSINENNEVTKFAEFKITNEVKQHDVFILGRHLRSANPESIYSPTDKIVIENSPIFLTRNDNTYLKISGSVADYSSGDIEMQIYKGEKIISEFKIKPMSNGNFLNTVKIDDRFESGFLEIHGIYDDREFAISEFLIVKRNIIIAEFGSEPVKISRDMFIESGGLVTVKITGEINNYKFGDSGMLVFTLVKPNGMMETFDTEIKKWGYFAYNIPVTSEWQSGTYIISAQLGEKKAGHMYLQILDYDMQWIKNMTHDWISGEISTYQYANRLDSVIENDTITEKEFFNVLKFLTA